MTALLEGLLLGTLILDVLVIPAEPTSQQETTPKPTRTRRKACAT